MKKLLILIKSSNRFYAIFAYATTILAGVRADSQTSSDSLYRQQSIDLAVAQYTRQMGERVPLYRGTEYVRYNQAVKGHPFFRSNQPQRSKITYNGVTYDSADLFYDLTRQELIVQLPIERMNLVLDPERVDAFVIGGQRFIYMDSLVSDLRSGYYEVLFSEGSVSLISYHTKLIIPPAKPENPSSFREFEAFYIGNGKAFVLVGRKKKDLLVVFPGQNNEMRRILRESTIDFKKDKRGALLEIIRQYARLRNLP